MTLPSQQLFGSFDREQLENEIDEELRFHLESLTAANLQQDLTFAEAKAAALKRFGNVQQIKNQCVEISRRNRPMIRFLKVLMIALFLLGVLIRVSSTEMHVTRIGDILMFVGVMGRLLVHLRGWRPAENCADPPTTSPLMLIDKTQTADAYERRTITPVERLISEK
jgi:hypothetical protein